MSTFTTTHDGACTSAPLLRHPFIIPPKQRCISHLNNNIMRSYYSIARCLVAVLLTSDAASAFTALPPPGVAMIEGRRGGRCVVVVFASSSRNSLDAPSSSSESSESSSSSESESRFCDGRSAFLRTSFVATIATAAATAFAPAIAFAAGGDAAANDDLSMPEVEEQKISEVSTTVGYNMRLLSDGADHIILCTRLIMAHHHREESNTP